MWRRGRDSFKEAMFYCASPTRSDSLPYYDNLGFGSGTLYTIQLLLVCIENRTVLGWGKDECEALRLRSDDAWKAIQTNSFIY
jgi:hypothetical protein